MVRLFFLLTFFSIVCQTLAADDYLIKKDLQEEWKIYNENKYQPYNPSEYSDVHTIYFGIKPDVFKNDRLLFEGYTNFSLFINGKLFFDRLSTVEISIDSLIRLADQQPIVISIHAKRPIQYDWLKTHIVTDIPSYSVIQSGPLPKPDDALKNFVILAVLGLAIFFGFILRLNPKLTFHHFSIRSLFSKRDSDESHAFNKLLSTGNILFYILAALLTGFLIILLLNAAPRLLPLAFDVQVADLGNAIFVWIKISGAILLIFLIKALVIVVSALLFDIRDESGFQFLNFIRLVLMSAGFLAVIGAVYFILNGRGIFEILYGSIHWFLLGWVLLAFAKLFGRVRFSPFHLFSYLCITEIVPFLFIVKLLYE